MERSGGLGAKAELYTDLSQLNDIKRQAKNDGPVALAQVAKQFEQLFVNMMLKSMREANETFDDGSPFNSQNVKFYQGMLDQQLSLQLSQNKGIGLADVLVKQLGHQMHLPSGDTDKRSLKPLDESERLLRRAADSGTSLGAMARLGQQATASSPTASGSELPPFVSSPFASGSTGNSAGSTEDSGRTDTFTSPQTFVDTLLPLAERVAPTIGVDPKVLVAQAALETGWGQHILQGRDGRNSHNLFNIKADGRWQGERVGVNTLEYRNGVAVREPSAFRAYGSYADSMADYVRFVQQNPRYRQALEQAADPAAYLQQLQAAGYATDPDYARKIERIFRGDQLAEL